ncbi:SH3 domain-containing protein [Massilia sp. PWRC2]|uniref:SH3 domain-containing protein n=1 Tax=Massilia sp. PWRC2 TaxID=2804626 RepID=UPI003CF810B9
MGYLFAIFAAAFVLTLALASVCTPAHWWRRPNLKAITLVAAGSWGIGSALLALAPPTTAPAPAQLAGQAAARSAAASTPPTYQRTSYRAFDDLNLRASASIDGARLALVPAGATVTTTGVRAGDWWQVRASIGQRQLDGWVSSLWLRRAEEAHARQR